MVAITAARARSVAIIRRRRSTRSTQAPMTSPKSRYGTNSAAVVMPRLIGEPVRLNTSRGSANIVKELPRLEIVWPSQKRPKSPDSSQLRRPLARAVMAAFWQPASGGRGHRLQWGVAGAGGGGVQLAGHRQHQGLG